MAKYNNTSIGFDTFDRGDYYDGGVYTCSCSADGVNNKGLSTIINDSWSNTITAADCNYVVSNKYDHLQDEINMLKEQLNKVSYSAGAALKNAFNRLSDGKLNLRNQLQTIGEWQTI